MAQRKNRYDADEYEYLLYFDGGCRDNQTVYAYVIQRRLSGDKYETVFSKSGRCGKGSSNDAEYRALCLGVQKCLELGYRHISIFGDSQIVVKHVNGKWKYPSPHFLLIKTQEYLGKLDGYKITWIRRRLNKMADDLVKGVFRRCWPRPQYRS